MITTHATEQLELIEGVLTDLQTSTGAELDHFDFVPHMVEDKLYRVTLNLYFDPMVEEK